MKKRVLILTLAAACSALPAAENKPLTNADIVRMVKAELPESTILMTIRANPKLFDSSVEALLELQKSGVPPVVMEIMLRGDSGTPEVAPPATPSPAAASSPPADSPPSPGACLLDRAGTRTPLTTSSFKIVETRAGGSTIAAIASDPAVAQIAGEVMRTGAAQILSSTGGRLGGTINAMGGLASGLGKKLFKSDEVTLTYVYALDGSEAAQSVLPSAIQRLEVNYANVAGVNPDAYEPALINLTPTPQNWRMAGAMKAKKSEFNESTPRELAIIEDRVSASVKRLARGRTEITPVSSLPPGEYAVVLRPLATAKRKYLLQEFEQGQGEAAVLRLLWDFRVAAAP